MTDRAWASAPRVGARDAVAYAVWPVLLIGSLTATWWGFTVGLPVAAWAMMCSSARWADRSRRASRLHRSR